MLHIPWQTTAASSFDIHCSDKVIEQLRRECSEPLHPTSVRWVLNLPGNKPLGRATAPVGKIESVTSQCTNDAHYKVRRLVLVSWSRYYTCHRSFHTWVPKQNYITTKEMTLEKIYHGVRIQVVCRLQRHPDCPRSHHTLYHRFHWCRLQPYPWLAHPCWSKCHHPHGDCNNLESHRLLEAWHHLQCKRLMEERRTSINNNIWSWRWTSAENFHWY